MRQSFHYKCVNDKSNAVTSKMRGIKLFENYDLLGATKYYSEFLVTLLFVDILSQNYRDHCFDTKK